MDVQALGAALALLGAALVLFSDLSKNRRIARLAEGERLQEKRRETALERCGYGPYVVLENDKMTRSGAIILLIEGRQSNGRTIRWHFRVWPEHAWFDHFDSYVEEEEFKLVYSETCLCQHKVDDGKCSPVCFLHPNANFDVYK